MRILVFMEELIPLHVHKKYGVLIPLGGHIEDNELPEESLKNHY